MEADGEAGRGRRTGVRCAWDKQCTAPLMDSSGRHPLSDGPGVSLPHHGMLVISAPAQPIQQRAEPQHLPCGSVPRASEVSDVI